MGILNELNPKAQGATAAPGELEGVKDSLDASAMSLLIQELEYDEKCLAAYFSKMDSYQIRLSHLKNEWVQKRLERAKTSVFKWMDQKVGV